jgi:hypothetical protein
LVDGTAGAINLEGELTTTNATASAVTVRDATTVALGDISAANGTVVVGVAGNPVTGDVTQNAGTAIVADALTVLTNNDTASSATITLTNTGNNAATIDLQTMNVANNASVASNIQYTDSNGFVVTKITTAGDTQLTNGADGAVTQTGTIESAGLLLLGSGSYTLTNAANTVTTIAANNNGEIQYVNATGLTVGTVLGTTGITTLSDDVLLTATTGNLTITEQMNVGTGTIRLEAEATGGTITGGGQITAVALGARTNNGAVTLDNVLNDVNTLAAATNGGTLTFVDANGVDIGAVTEIVGLFDAVAGVNTGAGDFALTAGGDVTQSQAIYVGGTTDVVADGAITLANTSNDFVGQVNTEGTAVTLVDSNNLYLGLNEATAGAISMTAGQSIYNALTAGGTNITSTAASMLAGNGGVVGTLAKPVTVSLPSVTATATQQQGGVSIDLSGYVGDNTIWLTQTPPGLVILNGMIINPGQIPGVPQNAYATALAVLDQTYLTGNGNVLNTKPYSTVGTLNSALYPTDDNDKAFNYGPYIYKLPRNVKVKDGGVKLPAGVQIISMNK